MNPVHKHLALSTATQQASKQATCQQASLAASQQAMTLTWLDSTGQKYDIAASIPIIWRTPCLRYS